MKTLRFLGVVFLFYYFSGFSVLAANTIPAIERQALIALYNSTNGDGWTNNSGWKTPPLDADGFAMPGTEGTWYGVTVGDYGALYGVREINLGSNHLSGSIPPELGNLTRLNVISLGSNQLSGSIPNELASITQRWVNKGNGLHIDLSSNQISGPIPIELGKINIGGNVWFDFSSNQLSGAIPPELGNIDAKGISINFSFNQLSGAIPPEMGNLMWDSLGPGLFLNLSHNQLSGAIPPELQRLTCVVSRNPQLDLSHNQLSGAIPAELGNVSPSDSRLRGLSLGSNRLSGPIPASFINLTALDPVNTDFGYNALYANDPALIAFLNTKDPDWASTQTVAPDDVVATAAGGTTVLVSWTPILYTGDMGGYIVSSSLTSGGPYIVVNQTSSKSVSSMMVSGLAPGQPHYFIVRAHTDAHAVNQNVLESENSAEAAAATFLQLTVAGAVLVGDSPLANVVMFGLPGNPTTSASGAYQSSLSIGWSGKVMPTLAGYVFVPSNRNYSGLSLDQWTQDFEALVTPAGITISSPNGGEAWNAGSAHNITWSWTGTITNVKIEYSVNNGTDWMTIIATTPNSGSYPWSVPGQASASCLVKVSDAGSPGIFDQSNAVFTIVIKEDFVGTWDGQGLYYQNSDTGGWARMASPATMIATGDLDGDGINDLIGLWPTLGGIWVKYSSNGTWVRLSSTARYIGAGDMNGDGRVDLVGTWDGQGVYYRNSLNGAWIKMASPATMITAGDLDGDGTDDLIGIWPGQGGVWVKYSQTGAWARLSSTARDIAAGDMNGDGRDDLLATWDGQGVYYRNSMNGVWVRMASEATQVTCGDLDGDATDDLIGIWPTQGGVWVKYSETATWELLSSTATDIAAGKMRAASVPSPSEAAEAQAAIQAAFELPLPIGGDEQGPGIALNKRDISDRGPGGARFVYLEEKNLVPREDWTAELARIPSPGEPGFVAEEQKNVHPGEVVREDRETSRKIRDKKKDKR